MDSHWGTPQNPSDASLAAFGACSRHASDVPSAPHDVPPPTLPRRRPAAVCRLELMAVDHPEASPRLRAERRNQVARHGHRVHGATVDALRSRPNPKGGRGWAGHLHPATPKPWANGPTCGVGDIPSEVPKSDADTADAGDPATAPRKGDVPAATTVP